MAMIGVAKNPKRDYVCSSKVSLPKHDKVILSGTSEMNLGRREPRRGRLVRGYVLIFESIPDPFILPQDHHYFFRNYDGFFHASIFGAELRL